MKNTKILLKLKEKKGVTAVLTAIMIAMFLGFAALAIDIGFGMVTKNELQNIADAAALAATRQLGNIYLGMTPEELEDYTLTSTDITNINNAAIDVADKNKAGGKSGIEIRPEDILIGSWVCSSDTTQFCSADTTRPKKCWLKEGSGELINAVKVIARRDSLINGSITTFFAKIFGIQNRNVVARATASLTGESIAPEGGLPLPVGISEEWFLNKEEFCDQPIKFYPTGSPEGCAGWNTYSDDFYDHRQANASKLRVILDALRTQSISSPETIAGSTYFQFTGGNLATAFSNMKDLFDTMKVLNDGVLDADTDSTTWTTAVPVYDPDGDGCSNPTGDKKIIGFATVVITQVLDSPIHTIDAHVICDNVESGPGGGGPFGTLGDIPGLVRDDCDSLEEE